MKHFLKSLWEFFKTLWDTCDHDWNPPKVHSILGTYYVEETCKRCKKKTERVEGLK